MTPGRLCALRYRVPSLADYGDYALGIPLFTHGIVYVRFCGLYNEENKGHKIREEYGSYREDSALQSRVSRLLRIGAVNPRSAARPDNLWTTGIALRAISGPTR
jgi:hypothetical protein